MKNVLLVFFLFAALSLKAQEGDDLMQMSLDDLLNMQVDVAASKSTNIFKSPSTVSVIDKQMIKQFNFQTVSEALNYIPDFNAGRAFLKQGIPTSRGVLEDVYANKVLMMINGVPLWNAVTGQPELERIGIDDIERIEVLKGPASVLYGTNAYVGAINIVLKKETSDKAAIHATLGEFGKIDAGANFAANFNDMKLFVSANSNQEDGDRRFIGVEGNDSGYVNDYYNTNNFTADLKYKGHDLLVNAFRTSELGLGAAYSFTSGAGSPLNHTGYAVAYNYNDEIIKDLSVNYGLTYDWSNRHFIRGYSKSDGDSIAADVTGYRVLNELNLFYNAANDLSIELFSSFDYLKSDFYRNITVRTGKSLDENNMNGQDNAELSVGAQVNYDPLEYLTFNVGTRYTNNRLAGDNLSSRATAVLSINEKNSLKFIFGQSFRAPTLFEQYFATSALTVFGNSKLKPETSNSFELMYVTSFDNFVIQIDGFYSTYIDKIYRGSANVQYGDTLLMNKIQYLNGKDFSAKGIEAEIRYTNKDIVNGYIGYSYIDGDSTDVVDGSYNYLYVPKNQFTFGLAKNIGRFTVAANGIMFTDMQGGLEKIDAQYILNFNIQYTHKAFNTTLRHVFSIKNFMNAETEYPEFSRRKVNSLPWFPPKVISYSIFMEL